MATSAAHPIIYGTLNQEFAKGFKTFFRCAKETKRKEILKPAQSSIAMGVRKKLEPEVFLVK